MTTMKHSGMAKLAEELGELQQIVGKMLQFPELHFDNDNNHPSGYNLRREMEKEMGDVRAAIRYVAEHLKLDTTAISSQSVKKHELFLSWGSEE